MSLRSWESTYQTNRRSCPLFRPIETVGFSYAQTPCVMGISNVQPKPKGFVYINRKSKTKILRRLSYRIFQFSSRSIANIGNRTWSRTRSMGRNQLAWGLWQRQSGRKITGHETANGWGRRCAHRYVADSAVVRAFRLRNSLWIGCLTA